MVVRNLIRKRTSYDSASTEAMSQKELTEKIRRKAYELYEKRGRTGGHAMEDWFRAEKIVRSGKC